MEPNDDQFDIINIEEDYVGPNLDQHPADISILATSTKHPERPRTVRAGYEYKTHTLTVIFRDGTWWNYYDVPVQMWEGFRNATSKGEYLAQSGLNNWDNMGAPSMASMSDSYRRALSESRYAQIGSKGKQFRKLRGARGIEAIRRGRALGQRGFEL